MLRYNAPPTGEGIVTDKDILAMSRREVMRLHLLHQALERKLTQREAARLMDLSDRQVRRLLQRVRREGDGGICHRARGQASNRRLAPAVKARVLALFRTRYRDFNLVHATEKLAERHGLRVHAETLRLWVRAARLPYKRRKARPHRCWRERKAHRGELVQFDGSHHDWFEGRGPRCVFLGAIDDATNTVLGQFYEYEGTWPAMDCLKRYIRRYGIPQAIYLDKHTTYKSPAPPTLEEQLRDAAPLSHVGKSLAALGITVIHAHSPQAKGRVERLFQTLQDRLVRELRLHGIQSVAAANAFLRHYLPAHNRRFCQPPASPADLHRPAPPSRTLDRIFCIRTPRTVRPDFTVAHAGKRYQIDRPTRAKQVTVEEWLDGTRQLVYRGQPLRYHPLPGRLSAAPAPLPRRLPRKQAWTPPPDHPWRRRLLLKRPTEEERTVVRSDP